MVIRFAQLCSICFAIAFACVGTEANANLFTRTATHQFINNLKDWQRKNAISFCMRRLEHNQDSLYRYNGNVHKCKNVISALKQGNDSSQRDSEFKIANGAEGATGRTFKLIGGANVTIHRTFRTERVENIQIHAKCLSPEVFDSWVKNSVGVAKSDFFVKDKSWFVMQLWHRQDTNPRDADGGTYTNVATLASQSFNLHLDHSEVFDGKTVDEWLTQLKGTNPSVSLDSDLCKYVGAKGRRLWSFDASSRSAEDAVGDLAFSFAVIRDSEPGRIFAFAKTITSLLGDIKLNFDIAGLAKLNIEHTNGKIDVAKNTVSDLADFRDSAILKNFPLEFDKDTDEYILSYGGRPFMKLWTERKDTFFPKFDLADDHQQRAVELIEETNLKTKITDSSLKTALQNFITARGIPGRQSIAEELKGPGVERRIRNICEPLSSIVARLTEYTSFDKRLMKLALTLANSNDDVAGHADKRWPIALCLGRADTNALHARGRWLQTYDEARLESEDDRQPEPIWKIYEDLFDEPANALLKFRQEYPTMLTEEQTKSITNFVNDKSTELRDSRDTSSATEICSPMRILTGQVFMGPQSTKLKRAVLLAMIARNSPSETNLLDWQLAACLTPSLAKTIVTETELHKNLVVSLNDKQNEELDRSNEAGVWASQLRHMEIFRKSLAEAVRDDTFENAEFVISSAFGGAGKKARLPGDNRREQAKQLDVNAMFRLIDRLITLKGKGDSIGMGCYHRVQPECSNEYVHFKVSGNDQQPMLFGKAQLTRNTNGSINIEYLELRQASQIDCRRLQDVFEGSNSSCGKSKPWLGKHCSSIGTYSGSARSQVCTGSR